MKRVAVYCGSGMGLRPEYRQQAEELGRELARRDIMLVYGGGRVGLMGAIAEAVMKEGGEAIGVIPRFLERKEVAHNHLTQLYIVDTMHQRKTVMAELSEGFIALPGGFGTLEEWFEILTWAQLGHHTKPVALLNTLGYYDTLLNMIENGCREGFIKKEYYAMVLNHADPMALLDMMDSFKPVKVEKWLDLEKV